MCKKSIEFSLITAIAIDTLSTLFPPEEYAVLRSDAETEYQVLVGTMLGNLAVGVIDRPHSVKWMQHFLKTLRGMDLSAGLLISTKAYPEELKDIEHDWDLNGFAFQIMDVGEAIHMFHGVAELENE